MKKSLLLSLLCLVAGLFVGCSDDSSSGVSSDLVVTKSELSFTKDGGSLNFAISTNCSWTAESSASWLTLSQTAGEATIGVSLTATAPANESADSRTATITVASGADSHVIAVSQVGSDVLTLSSNSITLADASAATFTVDIVASSTVTVTVADSWLTYEGEASGVYSFAVSANSGLYRTSKVYFACGDLKDTLTVAQPTGLADSDMPHNAKELAALMYVGINIGNTLEATSGETSWGNPKVTETYIQGLKSLGFNAVRIPCAWSHYIVDESTYEISSDWLDRVAEVVSYVTGNDMYAIVNVHWDGGWLEDNISSGYSETINAKQKALWTQIATKLNPFDEHLLFAGCNEPGMNESKYNATTFKTIMAYEQTFVDAVRATGGNNATRCLVVQGPGTNIDATVTTSYGYAVPTDVVEDRLLVEIHYYDPYQFCLMESDASWGNMLYYWGDNLVTGSDRNCGTYGNEAYIETEMAKMKSYFVDKGIPCIVGEFCAIKRTVDNQDNHNQSRADWNEAVVRIAKNNGLVPFYWETGTDINRSTGLAKEDYAIEGLMKGAQNGTYPF